MSVLKAKIKELTGRGHRDFSSSIGRRQMTGGIVSVLIAAALSAVLLTVPVTSAEFSDVTESLGNSLASDTLDPPTVLAAVGNASDIDLGWTATTDLYASGYNIKRGTSAGGPFSLHASVVGQSITTYTDVGANPNGPPTFESVATAIQGPNNGTGTTVSRPSGTLDGDLLVAVVGVDNSEASPSITAPAGWTTLFVHGNPGGNKATLGAWYRIASSEPGTYSFTWPAAEEGFAAVLRYSNADVATPINAWAHDGVTISSSPTAPDITTTVDNTLLLRIMGVDGNAHVEPSPLSSTHPPGTTGRFELITGVTGSGGTWGAGAEELQTTAGSTGTKAFSMTGSDGWNAATIAIAPAVGPTYYYVAESYFGTWVSLPSNETSCC